MQLFEASQASTTITTAATFDSDMLTILTVVMNIPLSTDVATSLIELGFYDWENLRYMIQADVDELKKVMLQTNCRKIHQIH